MRYKYDFRDKKKISRNKIIFIIVLIILSVIFSAVLFKNSNNKIVSFVSTQIIRPFNAVYNYTTSLVNKLSSMFEDKDEMMAKISNLEEENEKLKLEALESQKILDENSSLKKMLEIKKNFQHFDIVMGSIIYREHDNWTKTFKIDVGKNDGIDINQAVVAEDGLVGYISSVEDDTATVTTILDPSSAVSVKISSVNEPAILKGDLDLKANNNLKLEFIELDASVSISDMLYTSGLGSLYPASIPVGKIIEIVNSKNDINRYAIVEPNVNIKTISEVGVIKN
jgi:rod shape-determining protein MreC